MVAGQAGNNNKSHVFLDINSVTIDNKEFDLWVGQKLDSNLGPCPAIAGASQPGTPNQAADYVNFSRILATTVGSSMLQFTQAVLPSAATGPHSGQNGAILSAILIKIVPELRMF